MKSIVVLGASANPDRYAFKAMQKLQEYGYEAIPLNLELDQLLGERRYPSLSIVPQPIDTVTLYLGPARSTLLIDDIIKAKPRRIIFNPGDPCVDGVRVSNVSGTCLSVKPYLK